MVFGKCQGCLIICCGIQGSCRCQAGAAMDFRTQQPKLSSTPGRLGKCCSVRQEGQCAIIVRLVKRHLNLLIDNLDSLYGVTHLCPKNLRVV